MVSSHKDMDAWRTRERRKGKKRFCSHGGGEIKIGMSYGISVKEKKMEE